MWGKKSEKIQKKIKIKKTNFEQKIQQNVNMSKNSLSAKCNLKRRAWNQIEVGHQRAPKLQWSDSLFFIHDDDDNVKQSTVKLVHIAELLKNILGDSSCCNVSEWG